MSYITVERALSDEQKELLIKRLTEVSSEIMKVPQEFFVTTIKEVSDKNFGIGGKPCDILHIVKLDDSRESAFLIQDMFPIMEEYIEREYTIAGNHLMLIS